MRGRRTLSLLFSMSLAVGGAVPLQLAAELERGPSLLAMLSSLGAHLRSPQPVASKPVPQQRDGGPLRADPASSDATRAGGGAGRAPGQGIGALPPDLPEKRTVKKTVAGARSLAAANVAPQIDAQSPASGAPVPTLTPELLAAGSDPDGSPSALRYSFTVYDANAAVVAQSGSITARGWTVPAGVLRWGKTYAWTVTATDGAATSTSQQLNSLLPRFPQSLITTGLSQNGGRGFDPDTRNYTTTVTDRTVPTVGPALALERFYTTLDVRRDTAFGAGWSSLLDAKATEARDRAGTLQGVVVTYPNGQEVGFGRNPDGAYVAPAGRFATFTAISGGYKLVDKDGTAYTFTLSAGAGQYRVTAITDVQNRALTFQYANGRAESVTAASGRRLWIDWRQTGSGRWHVLYVSTERLDPDDPETSFTHEYHYGPDDELSKVCPPGNDGKCTVYEHTSASQHPSIVANAGPQSYWRLTETSGPTAASAVVANQGVDNAGYTDVTLGQPGPLAGATATSAGFNGTSSRVELPAKLDAATGVQSIALWFKANPGDRGVLFGYSADPITKATTSSHYTPALYIGDSGKLHGSLWTGTKTTIATTGAVNDGNWHHAVLVAGASKQWLYLDGAEAGTKTAAVSIAGLTGSSRRYLGAGFGGGGWPDQAATTATPSFFKGWLAEAARFDRPLTADEIATMHRAGTTNSHPVISILRPSGHATTRISYDRVDGTVDTVTDTNGGVWKMGKPTVSGSSQVYQASVLNARPTDYWRFAESGTWRPVNQVIGGDGAHYSDVGLGNSGGPVGDPVAQFDGEASYVALGDGNVPQSGPVSISLWFKMNAGANTGGVLYSFQSHEIWNDPDEDTDEWVPALYVGRDGKLRGQFCYCDGATPITTGGTVNDGQWHHVALAAGTGSTTMYLDGNPAGTVNRTVETSDAWNPYVGAGTTLNWPSAATDSTNGFFPGYLAEFAYYKSELSAGQAAAQFAARANSAGEPVKKVITVDPNGKWLTDVYELPENRKVSSTDALNKTTRFGYDTGGFLRTTTDPNGHVTTEEHDVRGNVVSSSTCQNKAAGKCSTVYFTYYPDATSTTLTPDPRNDVMLTLRDGRSSSATDNRYLTTMTYDAKGNRTAVTDPLGRVTRTTYSDGTGTAVGGGLVPAGLPTAVTTPGGARRSVAYYRNGDVASVTEPTGKVTSYVYDLAGRVTDQTEKTSSFPNGLVTSFGYDELSRMIWQVDPPVTNKVTGVKHTASTSMAYDSDGFLVEQHVQDTTGGDAPRTVFYAYNEHGQQSTVTDASGQESHYTYDLLGNIATETAPDGGVTRNGYDLNGHLTSTTMAVWTGDPNNPSPARDLTVNTKTYDPAGRLASDIDAMNWVTAYTYTDNGLTATITRRDPATGASFVQEDNEYDAAGNLVSRKTNNGVTLTNYAVDAAGRNTSSTLDPGGVNRVTQNEYSDDDTLLATNRRVGTGAVEERLAYAYDAAGNQISESLWLAGADRAARWRLDELTDGRAADDVGNGALTPSPGVTFSTERGGAAVLNGTDGRLTSSASPVDSSRSFTVAAWVKLSATGKTAQAVSADGVKQSPFQLRYDAPTNRWQFITSQYDSAAPGSVSSTSTSTPATGAWTHLAGVYDAGAQTMRFYVNGTLQDTDSAAHPFASSGGMTVGAGRWNGAVTDFWPGQVDDVQLYQKALTASEVTATRDGNGPGGDARVVRTSYRVDEGGFVRAATDPNGDTTDYTYDEADRRTVAVAPATSYETGGSTPARGRATTTTGYNTFGNTVEQLDPAGHRTTHVYDAADRLTESRLDSYLPPGASTAVVPRTTRTYDELGRLRTVTDALQRTISYAYDQLGRMTAKTEPGGAVTRHAYNLIGDPISSTAASGAVSTATYDYLGRMLTSTEVVRQDNTNYTTNYGYAPGGWPASTRSPAGVTASRTFNATGQVVSTTDGANSVTKLYYDALGRQDVTILPNGTELGTAFDKASRPVETWELDPQGDYLAGTFAEYDLAGRTTATIDERETRTTYTYDAAGRLTSQRQPVSASQAIQTSFGYDLLGNRTRFTNGRGNAFLTTYNSLNLPESVIEPSTTRYPNPADRTFTRIYDAAGQVVADRSPGSVTTSYEYDDRGHLTRQAGTGAEAATADRVLGYDPDGRLTSASAPGGTNTFTYDDRSRLRSTNGPSGAATFTYSPDGKPVSRADAAGTTNYTYDSAGRLGTVTNPAAALSASVSYNNLSQPTAIRYAGGNTRTFEYDTFRRLSRDQMHTPAGAEIAAIDYLYDVAGDLTDKISTGFGGTTRNAYRYDLAGQLTSWDNGVTKTTYEYDLAGNRTKIGNRTLTYDARDELMASSDGTQYEYTARGTLARTISAGSTVATSADAFGQIVSQQAPNGQTQTYGYDALGRAIRAGFSYSGLGNDLASDGVSTYIRDPSGDLFGTVSGGAARYSWTDQHSDQVAQFTSTGATLTGSVTYDPLGKVLNRTGMTGSLGYQQEWTDTSTGRVNMLARWYNPDTGQFDSRDSVANSPVGSPVSANRFAYANNSPLLSTDPTGHCLGCFIADPIGTLKILKLQAEKAATKALNWVASFRNQVKGSGRVGPYQSKATQPLSTATTFLAQTYDKAKNVKKEIEKKAKQAGKAIVTTTTKVVTDPVGAVRDGKKWVEKNADTILEVAAFATAIVAGSACTLLSGGTAIALCVVGTAAIINLAKDAAQGDIKNYGDAFQSLGTGAITGVTNRFGGQFLSRFGGPLMTRVTSNVFGRMVTERGGDAVSSGIGDAASQFLNTGTVNVRDVFVNAAIDGLMPGSFRRGSKGDGTTPSITSGSRPGGSPRDLDAARASSTRPASSAGDGTPPPGSARNTSSSSGSCPAGRGNSFSPETRVLMANGATKPIKDIKVGDQVRTTDPASGLTGTRKVTAVHVNHDRALTDLKVRTKNNRSALIHTTQHHEIWNSTTGTWDDAGSLRAGTELHAFDNRSTVLDKRNFTAVRDMHDLTVDELHTYYVLADDTPVLVHNCGATQVGYGDDNLSRIAIQARTDNNWYNGRNVSVYQYEDADGTLQHLAVQSAGRHAERRAKDALEAQGLSMSSVKQIYTELEPCGPDYHNCNAWLGANAPGVPVTYSFGYGPDRAGRKEGINGLRRAVNGIRNGLFE
ncbi:LamG-like jellyroll fold domain-containing protein [Actinoplanes sp. NPDC049596]|uniref:LamG-like jellyroll fold domain-containing protein n=1 Tax=unclassified Actinoplanes TaxID=2626549 RepID=UPI003413F694